ncbi:hypothetical protein NDU88_006031 [Pleurodeles waltl]|uniref:Uncharacterized protein n=1 Tax=Pleurodeles waltl TaxID=8319 RepID=A0AAV7SNC8_PLEWA|nr:hypothetical protein NDU88_006031 [Pleurodeles waltl]
MRAAPGALLHGSHSEPEGAPPRGKPSELPGPPPGPPLPRPNRILQHRPARPRPTPLTCAPAAVRGCEHAATATATPAEALRAGRLGARASSRTRSMWPACFSSAKASRTFASSAITGPRLRRLHNRWSITIRGSMAKVCVGIRKKRVEILCSKDLQKAQSIGK